ncbi:MAG: hypothetical protein JWP08_4096 [Bryobacterales bacterium]|nr:hypothetical protein [Bryobacterales bacterium]
MSLKTWFASKVLVTALLLCSLGQVAFTQEPDLDFLNHGRPVPDAHNCYPYDGRWNDRVDRALKTGFPVGIEQDLAWSVDPASGKGRVVVSHDAKTTGSEPEERQYFFERVRPLIEKELAGGDRSKWPLIVLHFDFKDQQPALLHAVWNLLGEYETWITTAPKTADPHELTAFDRKPILVLTEDPDAQEKVFFNEVPVGARLRLFGSAHTKTPATHDKKELQHLAATLPPSELLAEKPTNYRRWWNNSWYEVEEGGQPHAGAWTEADMARLRSLVEHAHKLGYWIRFYTLDGFDKATGREKGWLEGYNFGSPEAAKQRWRAATEAGVNFIATDQYEDLSAVMRGAGK